jgi:site-specific DNA-cytosine methylase
VAHHPHNHRASQADAPARTLTRNTHSDGALLTNAKHPINDPDKPSYTVTTKGDGRGAQGACVVGGWPWKRPATTVTARETLAPPGHHTVSNMSQPNAIKLTERAASILQGFPDGWHVAGETKRARWSQIGQAMPPGLAHAVFAAVAAWLRAWEARAA